MATSSNKKGDLINRRIQQVQNGKAHMNKIQNQRDVQIGRSINSCISKTVKKK